MLLIRGLLFDPATIHQLAWTLIHFLWQGIVLAGLLWVAMKVPRQSPVTRYVAACATLLLMAAAPVVTYLSLAGRFDDPGPLVLPADLANLAKPATRRSLAVGPGATRPDSRPATTARSAQSADPVASATFNTRWELPAAWARRIQHALPFLLSVWLIVTIALAVRQAAALVVVRGVLRRHTRPLREDVARINELPQRLGIRRKIAFLECPVVEAPATLGWLRPVVLIPPPALDSLPAEQLDALIIHELAHVRRYDYFINLIQSVVDSALAFHPATWWVSSTVREERENCCDEIAAEIIGSRKLYASALKTMEKLRPTLSAGVALCAAGAPLLRRISRLARRPDHRRSSAVARAQNIALLAPLLTAGLVFMAGAQLVATSVNVSPTRGLDEVAAMSVLVYDTLDIHSRGGHFIDALLTSLKTASRDGKTFDPNATRNLVQNVLADRCPDALIQIQVQLTNVSSRMSHERHPEWNLGALHIRMRLRKHLLEEASRFARDGRADEARDYARAALLLAAQEAGLNSASQIAQVLRSESFAEYSQLSSREIVRLNRAVDDHRKILLICTREMGSAITAIRRLAAQNEGTMVLSAEDVSAAHAAINDALSNILRVCDGRPDLEWLIAHVCWEIRPVLGSVDMEAWESQLGAWSRQDRASAYRQRWVTEAFSTLAPKNGAFRDQGKPKEELQKQVDEWQRRGMLPSP